MTNHSSLPLLLVSTTSYSYTCLCGTLLCGRTCFMCWISIAATNVREVIVLFALFTLISIGLSSREWESPEFPLTCFLEDRFLWRGLVCTTWTSLSELNCLSRGWVSLSCCASSITSQFIFHTHYSSTLLRMAYILILLDVNLWADFSAIKYKWRVYANAFLSFEITMFSSMCSYPYICSPIVSSECPFLLSIKLNGRGDFFFECRNIPLTRFLLYSFRLDCLPNLRHGVRWCIFVTWFRNWGFSIRCYHVYSLF